VCPARKAPTAVLLEVKYFASARVTGSATNSTWDAKAMRRPAFVSQYLGDLLLGTDRAMRLRLAQTGLALLLMLMGMAVVLWAAWVLDRPRGPLYVWTLSSLFAIVMVYMAIRCGWSRRFKDPSLTLPQMAIAIVCSATGYALMGPVRAIAFPNLLIILMFGMFGLGTISALGISIYALLAFGLSMALMASISPDVYPPTVELAHFMMLVIVVPAVSVLAGRLSRIRRRLGEQKQELTVALEQIQLMAAHDDLTGLLNRRHMVVLLEQETQRSLRSGQGFCLALIDMDHFKRVNDRYGHAAGDEVLRAFADTAQVVLRRSDVLARWGGEEFVLMQSATGMSLAGATMERLREQVAKLAPVFGEDVLQISFSAGLTEHRSGECVNQTLERADRLLYDAKAQGRNRVVTG
jgi:diguanylate cyclase (GGDEF)-like protein